LVRAFFNNHIYNESFKVPFQEGNLPGHVDIPRLHNGMVGGAFWSVFAPCPEDGDDFSDENYAAS
jgi:membrane dipeptidase